MHRYLLRIVGLSVLLCGSLTAHAELVIEITQGQDDAVPIAIVPFGWEASPTGQIDVADIVAADLKRSGRFAPIDRRDMVDKPTVGTQIKFQDWRYLKTDYIAVGKVTAEAGGYVTHFELYNVLNGQKLLAQSVTASATTLRSMAHRVADAIFQQLTGIPGAFATRIAFVRAEGPPTSRTYKLIVADADGENQFEVASSTEPLMSPSWSPDGQSLAYVSFESKASAIYVQTLRTGERRRVSARSGINASPAWSPDGSTLALALSRKDGDEDIYTLQLSSQLLTRMTFDPGIDTEPVWSQDGKRLYFTSDRSGGPQIYTVLVDSPGKPERLTFDGTYNARPRLSPDGKQLAIVHLDDGKYRIATFDLGNKSVRVVSQGSQDESPSFAPNGALLIYATADRGRGVLAWASPDGRVQARIPDTKGDIREPAWSPILK
jgi:TolB protein